MNRAIIFGIILLSKSLTSNCQINWPVGNSKDKTSAWIKFDSTGNLFIDTLKYYIPIASSIAVFKDDQNKLLFTNGCGIYDYDGILIKNGDKINQGTLSAQVCNETGYIIPNGVAMIQFPGSKDSILLIHSQAEADPQLVLRNRSLLYSLIVRDELKEYAVMQKNVEIKEENFDNFQIIKHANGRDYWILLLEQSTLNYDLFLVHPTGIDPYKISNKLIGPEINDSYSHSYCKFSNNGELLSIYNTSIGLLIYGFDRCSGNFTFRGNISSLTNIYNLVDLSYSLNDSLLFVSGGRYINVINLHKIGIELAPYVSYTMPLGCLAYRLYTLSNGNVLVSDIHSKPVYHLMFQDTNNSFTVVRNNYSLSRRQLHSIPMQINDNLQAITGCICDTIKTKTNTLHKKEIPDVQVQKILNKIYLTSNSCYINRVQLFRIDGRVLNDSKFDSETKLMLDLPPYLTNTLLFARVYCDKSSVTLKIYT